jgi:hypothetical protein
MICPNLSSAPCNYNLGTVFLSRPGTLHFVFNYNLQRFFLFYSSFPRMMFGLFYNTPIVTGCQNSGLFQAFSEFLLHRLGVATLPPPSLKLRLALTLN